MSKRNVWILIGVVAAGVVALRLGIPDHPNVHPQARDTSVSPPPAAVPEPSPIQRPLPSMAPTLQPAPEVPVESASETRPSNDGAIAAARAQARQAKHFADVQIANQEKTPSEQIARIALSFVGVDADAEDVWVSIINDPTMAAEDRKNLIEDLNEDGFGDPDHPTPDELPLILNRLALIESLAPDAIDDVNLAAFAEAHKDLLEMARRLTQ